jgi:hypothetical protein
MCYSLLFDEPKVEQQHLYLHVLGALLGTNKKVKNEKEQFYQRFERKAIESQLWHGLRIEHRGRPVEARHPVPADL